MTELEARDVVFVWRQRVGGGLRDIPITITWHLHEDSDGENLWVPVKFVIDGGGQRLGQKILEKAPLAYAIGATDPGNVDPVVSAFPARPRKPKPDPEVRTVPSGTRFTPLDHAEKLLGVRAYNALRRGGIATLEQALALTDEQLVEMEGIGEKSLGRIKASLNEFRMVASAVGWPAQRDARP